MFQQRVIFLMLLLAASQPLRAQPQQNPRVSVTLPDTTLEAALQMFKQQTAVFLSYENSRVRQERIKACSFRDTPLETVLTALLANTSMTFRRSGAAILIVPRKERRVTYSGYLEDAASGERIIGASVAAPDFGTGTASNQFGFFSITLPAEALSVKLSAMGYTRIDTLLRPSGNTPIIIRLQPAFRQLNEITVRATREERIQESSQMSRINLPAAMVQSMPRIMGEADLLKTLQMLPGVKQGTEGTSALLVRGGTPDQNLFLLDGAPLYNPSHLFGIFSTFNTSVLKDVTLYKGAFPARYGGRLSAVVDVATNDGDMKALHGDFSIGLLASQLTVHGPLKKDKTSFVLSGRRSYVDLVAKPILKSMDSDIDKFQFYFYDINAKLHHKISEKDQLYLSFYNGRDKLRARSRTEYGNSEYSISDPNVRWGNTTGTLRWNHVFSGKLFANTMLIGSRYRFGVDAYSEDKMRGTKRIDELKLTSGIEDYGVKTDLDYRPVPAHSLRLGGSAMLRRFTPGTQRKQQLENDVVLIDTASANEIINGTELDLYAEDDWTITKKLKVNIGLHWSAFAVQQRFYHNLQPRLNLRYLLPGDWALKASYTRMAQYIHLLANNSVSLPTDLWVPATKKVLPQLADQYALGIARNVFHNRFEFSLEGYYKRMQNVIEYREGSNYITSAKNDNWQNHVVSGTGEAYGLEALLQKKTGRLTGWLGYTLAWSYRRIEGVNFGRWFPYKYDRRHDVHVVAVYKLTKGVELTGAWTYQSAAPFTVPLARYDDVSSPVPGGYPSVGGVEYTEGRNNVRVEPYHRLDLGVNFIKYRKNGQVRTWNISVINAYNKVNPFFYYVPGYTRTPQTTDATQLRGTGIMPILPSLSYNLKF